MAKSGAHIPFGVQLQMFAQKTGATLADVDVGFKLSLLERVVRNTRVADPATWKRPDPSYLGGTMRGNWQITSGAPASGPELPTRNTSLSPDPSEVAKIQPFSKTFLTNTTSYFPVWNEVDGTIPKAISNARAALRRAVGRANR